MTIPPRVLELSDAGQHPAAIAERLTLPVAKVYAILREHRPDRPRAPRRLTAWRRPVVKGMATAGVEVARVAELLGCSRAYVYRLVKEATEVEK
jgi:AraC-like DNA-binding protein